MSKFWAVVTVLFFTALGALAANIDYNSGISFTDLETECRYDISPTNTIGLNGDRITFSGRFNTPNPNTATDYSYSRSGSNVKLDITTRNSMIPDTFYNNCLASVVYEGETESLEPGDYNVKLYHKGDLAKRVTIRVK